MLSDDTDSIMTVQNDGCMAHSGIVQKIKSNSNEIAENKLSIQGNSKELNGLKKWIMSVQITVILTLVGIIANLVIR